METMASQAFEGVWWVPISKECFSRILLHGNEVFWRFSAILAFKCPLLFSQDVASIPNNQLGMNGDCWSYALGEASAGDDLDQVRSLDKG